jgi:hypothetical protein
MQSTLQRNEKKTMSLAGKRLLTFLVFAGIGGILGFLGVLIPLSIWAIHSDPTGSGSGYFIFGLLMIGPIAAAPGLLMGGLVALLIVDRALQATTRSRADYVRFLIAIVVSAVLGIGLTWFSIWQIGIALEKMAIPEV